MAKVHDLKRKLKKHARSLSAAGKRYVAHTRMTAEATGSKVRRMKIKKQLKILESALKKLCKMEGGR